MVPNRDRKRENKMEALDFQRRAQARSTNNLNGYTTHSMQYGLRAVAPEHEQRVLAYPAYALYRRPLQDDQGRAYFMPGLDTPGDPNHPIRPADTIGVEPDP